MFRGWLMAGCLLLGSAAYAAQDPLSVSDGDAAASSPYILVLGSGQDAGVPQAGGNEHPGWTDTACRRLAPSIALVDPGSGQRWLFDASPDFPEQLRALDQQAPASTPAPGLAGIFLTHAHIGHYTGLMFLGRESMGSDQVPVYAMPAMTVFLQNNGPWSQLVEIGNIQLRPLGEAEPVALTGDLSVVPVTVPHRDEYSETVGFEIRSRNSRLLYLPDIDQWDAPGLAANALIDRVDIALIDGTFFSDQELPDRDMSSIPHPRVVDSVKRFGELAEAGTTDIRFIHLNQSNPLVCRGAEEISWLSDRGFGVVQEGDRILLH